MFCNRYYMYTVPELKLYTVTGRGHGNFIAMYWRQFSNTNTNNQFLQPTAIPIAIGIS